MTDTLYTRTEMLLHSDGMQRLKSMHVLVVGLGGVGGCAAEMLCRSGVGRLTLVDSDMVAPSNINRQLIAFQHTVGQPKTSLFAERFRSINPDCEVTVLTEFLRDESMVRLLESEPFDYVVDAIDTLSPKVFLLYHAHRLGLPVVSSMGSAGKVDPSLVRIADIAKSHTCPLAAMVRKRLRRLGVSDGITAVFSTEQVDTTAVVDDPSTNKRTTIGTVSYLPVVFGCFCASVVIRSVLPS